MTTTPPPPPPWGELIRSRREAAGLSVRQAARQARISVTIWADTEKGFRFAAPGVAVAVRGTADKLASMAMVVGASPEELDGAGRRDAASVLTVMLDKAPPDEIVEEIERVAHLIADRRGLTERQRRALAARLRDAIDDSSR